MIARSNAAEVPVHFDGHNRTRFQIASHVHPTLTLALLAIDVRTRVGGTHPVAISTPLSREALDERATDTGALEE
jgi:putative hemolysin